MSRWPLAADAQIYKHPTSGGKVFVGNQTAAKTKSILEEAGVTYIVNCQSADSQNYLEVCERIQCWACV